ncbi:MAG: WecB/TagA/CpsF family glycosyltransferase [Gallintestinimicrobium sp.]
MYSPPFRPLTEEEDEAVVKQINDTKPDFIWIGLGAPKQEKWMAAHAGMLHGVARGVVGRFRFPCETVRRAPGWMQELCSWSWYCFRLMRVIRNA